MLKLLVCSIDTTARAIDHSDTSKPLKQAAKELLIHSLTTVRCQLVKHHAPASAPDFEVCTRWHTRFLAEPTRMFDVRSSSALHAQ